MKQHEMESGAHAEQIENRLPEQRAQETDEHKCVLYRQRV